MKNQSLLDEYYKKFSKEFNVLIPDSIYSINLELLQHLDLLHFQPLQQSQGSVFTQQFSVIESPEKITLFNDQFLIWILSEKSFETPFTCVLIALNREEAEPQLEAALIASGVYNSSQMVLNVLEKFLLDILETENDISHLEQTG